MNLNTNPTQRTNGKYLGRKDIGMTIRTTNNLPDSYTLCKAGHPRINDFCACEINDTPEPQNEVCAYCSQELVYQFGKGHLPHAHKPLVTNKAGEPYVVAWDGPDTALVFHPGDIEHYRITISTEGDMTCGGKSSGERCWPFYNTSTCVHCDAALASAEAGEGPTSAIVEVPKPARKEPRYTLESLYEEPLTATEVRRAAQYARKFGK